MSECISESRHKSQKVRRCIGCWCQSETNPIQIGDYYWSQFWVDGGDHGTTILFEACHAHLETPEGKAFWKECPDGWGPGEVLEDRKELAKRMGASV